MILRGHALDLLEQGDFAPELVATDPPYAFGGSGAERKQAAVNAIRYGEHKEVCERVLSPTSTTGYKD